MAELANSGGFSRAVEELARVVLGEETLDSVMELVASLAQSTIFGTRGVSITLRRDGNRLETRHATREQVVALDNVQYENRQGPRVVTIDEGRPHNVGFDEMRRRWPAFAAAAGAGGFRRVFSVPLLVRGRAIGAEPLRREARRVHTRRRRGAGAPVRPPRRGGPGQRPPPMPAPRRGPGNCSRPWKAAT